MQRWEIAGISAWPVVEALLALNIHGAIGITEVAFLKACIGAMTVAAIIRAALDSRKPATSSTATTTTTVTVPIPVPPPAVPPESSDA
jgi:predicted membrane-bound mannosyltransferase